MDVANGWLGRHFETNSADANHQVAKMLYRIATEIKCLPMLWHYSFFKARTPARARMARKWRSCAAFDPHTQGVRPSPSQVW
jgi:hypothetical protein